MNIVFIGIQGCGKGTLIEGLQKHLDMSVISIGQMLRDETKTGSEVGKRIKAQQDAGVLVDQDIVKAVLNKNLKNFSSKIAVFDGYPRNSAQADDLDSIANVDLVIYLNLPTEIAIERILGRLNCSNCGHITNRTMHDSDICPQCGGKLVQRSDDTEEGIRKRFEIYEKDTYPLIERYRSRGVLVEIDANQSPQDRLDIALKVINEHLN